VGIWLAVPAAVFGWDQNLRWLTEWSRIMIVPYVAHGTVVCAMSQSFGSFALRSFSAVPVFETNRPRRPRALHEPARSARRPCFSSCAG
jgi:hypothetical protein